MTRTTWATPLLGAALAAAFALASPEPAHAQGPAAIQEDESQGVKGLIATFTVNQPRDVVFSVLNDLSRFKQIFPNVLEVKVVRDGETSRDVFFRVDAVISEGSYTLRRNISQSKTADIISWNRLSGDANVIRGSWTLTDGPKEGTTHLTYRSYVDVGALIPTSTVRSLAISKVEEMVVRVRKACDERAAEAKPAPTP